MATGNADTTRTLSAPAGPAVARKGGAPADTGGRRRHQRAAFNRNVRVTELDDFGCPAGSWECRGVDLSRGGMGLRSRRLVHMGRSVLIEVPAPHGTTKVLFGVVRQSRYAEGEGYAIGVEFLATPTTLAVQQWLAERGQR